MVRIEALAGPFSGSPTFSFVGMLARPCLRRGNYLVRIGRKYVDGSFFLDSCRKMCYYNAVAVDLGLSGAKSSRGHANCC